MLLAVHRCQHRAVQAGLALQRTQADQIVVRKAEQRAQQGGGQIDILRRVVDDPQQRDEGPDVGRIQQVFPGVGVDGDAPCRQRFRIGREIAPGRKQHTAILILHGPGAAALPDGSPFGHQPGDLLSDEGRVRLGGVVGQKLGLHAARVVPRGPADQPLALAVGGIAQRRGHELLK